MFNTSAQKQGLVKKLYIVIFLALPDLFSMIISARIAYSFRFPGQNSRFYPTLGNYDYRIILSGLVSLWFLYFVISGIYSSKHPNLITLNLDYIAKKTLVFFFFCGFISFIFKLMFSRLVFLYMLIVGLLLVFVTRMIFFFFVIRFLIKKKLLYSNMMIIGKTRDQLDLHSKWLIQNRRYGFRIISKLICPSITSEWVKDFDRILIYNEITEILMLPGMEVDTNFSKFIHYCEDLEIHINWIPLDSGNLGYWLTPTPQKGIPFLSFEKSQISLPWRFVKRAFDLIFALSLMILLSPIFILISLVVLISSGWPIFYSQTRVGYKGKTFKFFKFRSMIKGADKIVNKIENMHEEDHVLFKNRKDPRITPVGRILRKYSLDELPQFLNVLNNTMSVVGPRPALPKEVYAYNSIYERRLNAKPGITGPWQISGRSDLDLGTSVALDLNYLTNWSFSRDLWIIFATIGVIFKGKGAY